MSGALTAEWATAERNNMCTHMYTHTNITVDKKEPGRGKDGRGESLETG